MSGDVDKHGGTVHEIADHMTDVVGICALTYITVTGEPSVDVIGAITTIALGARYAKGKWMEK